MDETGHSGDTGPVEGGGSGSDRDRARLNGWATPDSPWSALDPDEDVPAWRRPSQEVRPFARQPLPPDHQPPPSPFGDESRSGDIPPFGDRSRSGEVRSRSSEIGSRSAEIGSRSGAIGSRSGEIGGGSGEVRTFGDRSRSGEVLRPFGDDSAFDDEDDDVRGSEPQPSPAPRWSDSRNRYSDLLNHFAPKGAEPTGTPAAPPRFDALTRTDPRGGSIDPRGGSIDPRGGSIDPRGGSIDPRGGSDRAPRPDPLTRPGTLADDDRRLDAPPPNSAPPYPYEGDLDDARPAGPPPATQQRTAVPLDRPRPAFPAVRPATPRRDWLTTAETARHAFEPAPADPVRSSYEPSPDPSSADPLRSRSSYEPSPDPVSAEPIRARASYDPSRFPRRLDSPPLASEPPSDTTTGYPPPPAYPGPSARSADDPGPAGSDEPVTHALPQRVPAEPDVPTVPEPPSVEPTAETPALARIATHLRRGDVLPPRERQDGFDVNAILAAVREVEGVRDASLRSTPAGAHSLRLDLAEGADPAEVSRHVARLLQDRMGLDAAMQGGESARPAPPAPPATAFVPSQAGPTGRASVPGPISPVATGSASVPGPISPAATGSASVPDPVSPAAIGSAATTGEDLRRLPTIPQPAGRPAPLQPGPEEGGYPSAGAPPRPLATPAEPAGRQTTTGPRTGHAPVTAESTVVPADDPLTGPLGTVETVSNDINCGPPRPLEVNERPGPRVVIENVQVNTFGTEANVEVRLAVAGRTAAGIATGPAVDGYLLRLCAMATAAAVDELLAAADHADGPARCFVEHAASVPFGPMQVAVVVMLLSCGGWVEQLAGSAVVTGDDRHAMVRATLAAVNRRLEALLS